MRELLPGVHGVAWADDCDAADAGFDHAVAKALADGEQRTTSLAHIRETASEGTFTLRASITYLQGLLKKLEERPHKGDRDTVWWALGDVEKKLGALDAAHAKHGPPGMCGCGIERRELLAARKELMTEFAEAYDASEVATRAFAAIFPEPSANDDRRLLTDALSASSLLLVRSRQTKRDATPLALARGLIIGICRKRPSLGRKLLQHEAKVMACITASGSRGRPRKGAAPAMNSKDAVAALLRAVGLAASREALKSDKQRHRWGLVDDSGWETLAGRDGVEAK